MWDPGSTKVGNWFQQRSQVDFPAGIFDKTFMNNAVNDFGFPRQKRFSRGEPISYSTRKNTSTLDDDLKDCPLSLQINNSNVNEEVMMKSGLSVKMLSILLSIFTKFQKKVPKTVKPSENGTLLNALDEIKTEEFKLAGDFDDKDEEYDDAEDVDVDDISSSSSNCNVVNVMNNVFNSLRSFLEKDGVTSANIDAILAMLLDFKKSGDWGLISWIQKWNNNPSMLTINVC